MLSPQQELLIRNVLIREARRRGLVTYELLAQLVGLHYRSSAFVKVLDEIARTEVEAGRPMLTAVMVVKHKRRAGVRFLKTARDPVYRYWSA